MPEDVRTFLKRFTPEELTDRGVLSTDARYGYLLQGKNVASLILMMGEHDITRLEASDWNWYLTTEYDFGNPLGAQKGGDAKDPANRNSIFNEQNRHINPHYRPDDQGGSNSEPRDLEGSSTEPKKVKIGLERDLQDALRSNINQLEQGLKIIDNGSELIVDAGRIDITAEDDRGQIVVIELKAGTAQPESIAQLLAYMGTVMGTVENPDGKPVRGILVASDFNQRVVFAAQAVSNLSLKSYSFQFSFSDR